MRGQGWQGGRVPVRPPPFWVLVKPSRAGRWLQPLLPVGAPGWRVMGTMAQPGLQPGVCPSPPPQGCSRLSRAGQALSGSRQVLPRSRRGGRKMLREGRARSQQLCWRGVAQAGSPRGGWGGHWKMPGRTGKVPGTPQTCPVCWGQLGWIPPWKHSRPGPPVLGVTLGHHPKSHPGAGFPGGAVVQGLLQCHSRLWHGADPGECPCLSVPWVCLWMSSGSSFGQEGKPRAAGKGALSWQAPTPLSWGDTQPLTLPSLPSRTGLWALPPTPSVRLHLPCPR